MRRPAFYLALAFSGGILLCGRAEVESVIVAATLSVGTALLALWLPRGAISTSAALFAAVCAGVAVCSAHLRSLRRSDLNILFHGAPVRCEVRGILARTPLWTRAPAPEERFPWKGRAFLDLREIRLPPGWRSISGRVRVTFLAETPRDIARGDTLEISGTMRRIGPATNPGQFDRRTFWRNRGIEYSLLAKGSSRVKIRNSGGRSLLRLLDKFRARLRRGLESGVPPGPEREIITAMILGYRGNLGDEVSDPFRKTNTLHILAISGLHVGFFYLMIRSVLTILRVPRRASALIAIPLIAAYAVISGMRLPVTRASLMFICFLAAPLLGRRRETLNSLGVAALVLLVVNPLQLFDTGFRLSFAAVISIIVLSGPVEARIRRVCPCGPLPGQMLVTPLQRARWRLGGNIITLCAASTAAWTGLAPLIAGSFHIVSPLGLLGNLIVIPAGFVAVFLGIAGSLASLCLEPLARLVNGLNYCVVFAMRRAVIAVSKIPFGWFYVSSPTLLGVTCYYGIVSLVTWVLRRGAAKSAWPALLAITAVLVLLPPAFAPGTPLFRITFLDVHEGDSTFIEFPSGHTMLVDGGPEEGFPAGRIVVKPFIRSRGLGRIDTVLLTHPHLDHVSGLLDVLGEFGVGRLLVAGWGESTGAYRRLRAIARERGIPVHSVRRGDSVPVGEGACVTVLNPGPELHHGTGSDLNNNSVSLLVECGEAAMLLCADMESDAERELLVSGFPLRADILRTGHHGSRTSSTRNFVRRVAPGWAIISAGENNRFGHPSVETLARMRREGIPVYRTDLHGAITVTSDGKGIDIETYR